MSDGLGNADLWKWLLGIVAVLGTGGVLAWMNAINNKLGRIADSLTAREVAHADVEARVSSLEKDSSNAADSSIVDRIDRELGRAVAELKSSVDRVHMRLDGVNQTLNGQMAGVLERSAKAMEAIASTLGRQH